jgi:hypothetical protein
MSIVAVCMDATAPADGSPYSSCTLVEWHTQPTSIFDGLSMDDASTIAVAVGVLWAAAFCIRLMVKAAQIT